MCYIKTFLNVCFSFRYSNCKEEKEVQKIEEIQGVEKKKVEKAKKEYYGLNTYEGDKMREIKVDLLCVILS